MPTPSSNSILSKKCLVLSLCSPLLLRGLLSLLIILSAASSALGETKNDYGACHILYAPLDIEHPVISGKYDEKERYDHELMVANYRLIKKLSDLINQFTVNLKSQQKGQVGNNPEKWWAILLMHCYINENDPPDKIFIGRHENYPWIEFNGLKGRISDNKLERITYIIDDLIGVKDVGFGWEPKHLEDEQ